MAQRGIRYPLYNLFLVLLTLFCLPFIWMRNLMKHRPFLPYFRKLSRDQLKTIAGRPVLWVQAVSVGEVVVASCILKELRKLFPGYAVVFTTTTPTGQAMARKILDQDTMLAYFPYDIPILVKRFIAQVKPSLFLMVEAEIWPNVIRYCKKAGVRVALVNGLISDRSYRRYLRFSGFMKEVLAQVDLFIMQSAEDANRIGQIGAPLERIRVAGNAKFDQNYPVISLEMRQQFLEQYRWNPDDPVFVAASTHQGEEEIIIAAFKELLAAGPFRLILAPRHPERGEEVASLLHNAGLSYKRRSTGPAGLAGPASQVLLLDTFGELGLAYAVGKVVFVGGSLVSIGGHNVLEAAVQSKPVIYGPFMHKARESRKLLEEADSGFAVSNSWELVTVIQQLLADPALYQRRCEAARQAVLRNKGTTVNIARLTATLLEGPQS
jgi:3-deoxy-D-manno-octulosonic-acid transferase